MKQRSSKNSVVLGLGSYLLFKSLELTCNIYFYHCWNFVLSTSRCLSQLRSLSPDSTHTQQLSSSTLLPPASSQSSAAAGWALYNCSGGAGQQTRPVTWPFEFIILRRRWISMKYLIQFSALNFIYPLQILFNALSHVIVKALWTAEILLTIITVQHIKFLIFLKILWRPRKIRDQMFFLMLIMIQVTNHQLAFE